ncbi:peptidase [Sphingomonas koreensis]|jgi:prepilin peptidase CpaA|uniref:Peptidase n=1 Tax=Sphingomonas koreensis TaxID=93064 RepID=A0A1L6JES9_9SPHN|nr:prepilin peptidase [Sphingomonas koreensis]APR54441.1 peptidase [Sphingomonas koreensis]MDC7809476.1 prepilin peptidase [Sphingomonas koreensis]RSU20589.1 peptidase [Sphingomonas koreensis]RSU28715.1 peptidase [Sphingomonas koreensis]RSU29771.1 peptidase [Sphingomonas koreensis]
MGAVASLILLAVLGLLLVSAGIEDARKREIANWKNAAIALLAVPWWIANGLAFWPDIVIQIGIALAVFALFAAAFHFGMMGGGDVKMIGALALWFPFQPLVTMLIIMSLAGGAITVLMLIDKWLRRQTAQPEVPYGIAIAIAALLTLREPILNQFS